ncbi:MAG: LuxR C-terminal-related transcriptional regulator [Myxococcota bacterium]
MGDAYRELEGLLLRGLSDKGDGEEMAELTRKAFDLVGAGFAMEFSWEDEPLITGDLSRWLAAYPEVQHDDPAPAALFSAPEGTCYVVSHERTPTLTKEVFLREEYGDGVIFRFSGPARETVVCALYRDQLAGTFDSVALDRIRRLIPLWAGAFRTQSALNEVTSHPEHQRPALGAIEIGYPSGEVQWSRRARETLERSLGAVSGRGWKRLERALYRAVARSSTSVRRHRFLANLDLEVAHLPARAGEIRRVSLRLFERVHRELGTNEPRTPAEELLSARQRTIARLMVRGHAQPAIAKRLQISHETVRHHVQTIYGRLGAHRREDLIGLID